MSRLWQIHALERVLDCYQLTIEDISDRLVEFPEEDDDLDDLIGGLEEKLRMLGKLL